MKPSLLTRLEGLKERFEELTALLGDAEIIGDQPRFRAFSKEYADIEPIIVAFAALNQAKKQLVEAKALQNDSDPSMRDLAKEEAEAAEVAIDEHQANLERLLLPKDPADGRNVFLEIRAGTGGDEAAIFSGDLLRMYLRYVEKQGWRMEILSQSEGEHGGYKEVISRIEGNEVYAFLKFESGAHRVQRVPQTESQGRIHTSACTVAVLPEPDEQQAIEINPADLRIDTYRASGAGGQHINKTDSAIRITHLPTGMVVECQEERSQHKNRARALAWLAARLQDEQDRAVQQKIAEHIFTQRTDKLAVAAKPGDGHGHIGRRATGKGQKDMRHIRGVRWLRQHVNQRFAKTDNLAGFIHKQSATWKLRGIYEKALLKRARRTHCKEDNHDKTGCRDTD